MTGANMDKPLSPIGVPGPASSPTSDTLRTLSLDPELAAKMLEAFQAGSQATLAGAQMATEASTNSAKLLKGESGFPLWLIIIIYCAILIIAFTIFCRSDDLSAKNQALGFLFGQATLLVNLVMNRK